MAQQRMNVQAPIERLFAERWSTRAFDPDKPVTTDLIAACLEAARWAPSCFGEQPWRYIVADRFRDRAQWQAVLATLAEKNRQWAQRAPLLIVTAALPAFSHNGAANRWAEYDLGQASICLCLQAHALGLATHQMGGFDAAALAQAIALSDALRDDISLMSVIALGYDGDASLLDADLRALENEPRSRKPLSELVHDGQWGAPWQPPAAAGWEARYQETAIERLPWYHSGLDSDIGRALRHYRIEGGTALDIGCGPGTQAVALAVLGFDVTATDLSPSAVASARLLAEAEQASIRFVVDDILNSCLSRPFDLIVDRGVFHCFADAADQQAYLGGVKRLLRPDGMLLLKCFHRDETREQGPPGRYAADDIRRLFADGFRLVEAQESRFISPSQTDAPKALFCVLQRAES